MTRWRFEGAVPQPVGIGSVPGSLSRYFAGAAVAAAVAGDAAAPGAALPAVTDPGAGAAAAAACGWALGLIQQA